MSHTHNPSLLPPDREEGTFNLMQSVKRRFYAMRNGMLAAQMRQGGVDYRINFGLNIPNQGYRRRAHCKRPVGRRTRLACPGALGQREHPREPAAGTDDSAAGRSP